MNNLCFYIGGRGYGKAYHVMNRYNEARDIFNIRDSIDEESGNIIIKVKGE